MTQEMLEILIGKFLDSEITPGERRLLNEELQQNAESQRLFEALEQMHVQARAVVGTAADGRSATEVFEQAWRQSGSRMVRQRFAGWRRFAAGMAAGVIIGAGAAAYVSRWVDDPGTDNRAIAAAGDINVSPAGRTADNRADEPVIRQVDFYNFPDDSGGRWLIEGLREKRVQPAVYYHDL